MRAPSPRRAPRLSLALAIAVALAPASVSAGETLLLDLSVNGRAVDGIVTAQVLDDGRIVVPAVVWEAARLRLPATRQALPDGSAGVALDAVPGLQWRLDRNGLRLEVQAPATAFERHAASLGDGARPVPTAPARGLYLDYDAFASTGSRGDNEAGAIAELVLFGRAGALVHGQAWRRDGNGDHGVRIETFFQRDLPGRMETVVLGDAITSAGGWSRPARYAGIRYGREFATAPGFVTWPVPSLSGSASLPSTVDLLVNQRRQGQQAVPAGPFELEDVPLGNGAGDLQLVVTDVLGRETVMQQSYYIAPGLLAIGLSDFSYEAGWLRRNFGGANDRYEDPFASASYRRGINAALTLGVRAEWQQARQALGLHLASRIGTLGVVGASLATSRSEAAQGTRIEVSAQRQSRTGGASLRWSHADADFHEFGSLPDLDRTREEAQVSFGRRIGERVTVGTHAIQRSRWEDGESFRLVGADVSVSLRNGGHLSFDASRRLSDGGWAGSARLTLPMGPRRSALATVVQRGGDNSIALAEVRQGLPAGPGWGWRVSASSVDSQRVQADLLRRASKAEWSLESRLGPEASAVRAGARGAIGRVAGTAFASRRVNRGAFAVVQVGDVADAAVLLSNQPVATTDASGRALVTGLLPYQVNRLSIQAAHLPFDVQVGAERAELVPFARSGSVLSFPVRRTREHWLVLHDQRGQPLPEGARVQVGPGLAEFSVARRGEAYVANLADGSELQVHWKGGACRVRIEGRLLAEPGVRGAPLVCTGAAR